LRPSLPYVALPQMLGALGTPGSPRSTRAVAAAVRSPGRTKHAWDGGPLSGPILQSSTSPLFYPGGVGQCRNSNGVEWYKMVPNGARWCQMVPNGAGWCQMVPDGVRWCHMMACDDGCDRCQMVSQVGVCRVSDGVRMVSDGVRWCSDGVRWCQSVSDGVRWRQTGDGSQTLRKNHPAE